MGLYESFRTFLAEYGLTKAFDMAFESQHPGYRLDATLWDIMGENEYVFGRAIDWCITSQGHDYWADVDKCWHTYINNKTNDYCNE